MVKQFPVNSASFVCLDGNVPIEVIQYVCNTFSEAKVPIWFEPTCMIKAIKPIKARVIDKISYATPNLLELMSMHLALVEPDKWESFDYDKWRDNIKEEGGLVNVALSLSEPLLDCIEHLMVTLGRNGLLYLTKENSIIKALQYPPYPRSFSRPEPVNVSGAGDCLAAAIMGNCLVKGQPIEEAIPIGLQAAYNSLFSSNTVGEIVSNVSEEWINIKPKNIKN